MHITVAHILLSKAAHKVLSKLKREGGKVFPQRGVLKEVKPEFLGTRNTIYHTLQWLPIVLRIKSKTVTWPARLLLMLSQLNSTKFTSPLPIHLSLNSHYTILSFFEHDLAPSLFRILEHADPSILLPVFLSPLYSTISSCLGSIITSSEKPSLDFQARPGSFVICLYISVFFSFRALSELLTINPSVRLGDECLPSLSWRWDQWEQEPCLFLLLII